MKKTKCLLFFLSIFVLMLNLEAQTPKNHGQILKNIYIGVENEIDLRDYPNSDELSIGAQGLVISGKAPIFLVKATSPQQVRVKIKRNNQVLEEYPINIIKANEPIVLAVTNKYGLLKSGEYKKEVILDIIGLKVIQNVYWLDFAIQGFNFEGSVCGDAFSKQVSGSKLILANENNLSKLRVRDAIYFNDLKIKTPSDDGALNFVPLIFKVK